MKPKYLFSALAWAALAIGLTGCQGEKDLKIIEGDLPIKTSALYMVGDATPNGWSIDNPTPLIAGEEDPLVFTWEGQLNAGEVKLCLTTGSWDAPFIRPVVGGTEIGRTAIDKQKFDMHAGDPDNKWNVTEAGKYRLTFDLRNWTMSTAYLGEPDAPTIEPIEAESVYIVGDAAPTGWSIDAPTAMEKKSRYVFTYEGELRAGELKACIATGDWGVPFIRPASAGVKIGRSGVADGNFVFTTAPDDKWVVEEAGKYRLTFDLEKWTVSSEFLGEIEQPEGYEPIETEVVYIVGDATPNGWSIDEPTMLNRASQYVFVYNGFLNTGELKACIATGDWGVPFIRPASGGVKIGKTGVADGGKFVFTASPDDKWVVETAGEYVLTFDLEHYTLTAEFRGGGEPETPTALETETLYMIGDATAGGWSMDNLTALTRDPNNKYIFKWEGTLATGSMKMCVAPDGTFACPFVRPTSADLEISAAGLTASPIVYTTSPDDKWLVKTAGTYAITVDLEHWTITVVKK